MAALRGTITGDRTRHNSDAVSHRLADRHLSVSADTWRTFARTDLARDGSGSFTIRRDGQTLIRVEVMGEDRAEMAGEPTIDVTFGNGRTMRYELFTGELLETAVNPDGAATAWRVTR